MNISDTAALLTYAALGDNRTVTRETALFWSEALRSGITLDEARRAVSQHFGNSTEYLSPAHVNAIVSREREARARILPDVVPPRDLADDPRAEIAWKRIWGDAFIAGQSDERARVIANEQMGIEETEPLALEARPLGSLAEALTHAERKRRDEKRLAEIRNEAARRDKAEKRQAKEEAETKREPAPVDDVLARHAPELDDEAQEMSA